MFKILEASAFDFQLDIRTLRLGRTQQQEGFFPWVSNLYDTKSNLLIPMWE